MTGPVLSPTAVSGLMLPPLRIRALWFGLALLVWLVLAVPASAQMVIYPKTGQRFALLGRGEPTVIVLNGLASSIGEWMPVVRRVSAQTRVFVYERRGNGRSPVIASARGSRVIAEELLEMLDDLSISGPYVLVGHSLGAVYAQTFARLYPDQVAGLLLVDPSVEQLDRFMMGEDEEIVVMALVCMMSADGNIDAAEYAAFEKFVADATGNEDISVARRKAQLALDRLKVESLEAMVAECIERLGGIKDKPIAASFVEALDAIAEANNSEAWAEAEMFEKFKKALQGE